MFTASESIRNRLRAAALTIEITGLGIWTGMMAGFAFLFAPAAFHHIGNISQFAALIGACVGELDRCGYVIGALALVLDVGFAPGGVVRRVLLAAMLAGIAVEDRAVVPLMARTLAALPQPLSSMRAGDPARLAYDRLHHLSSSVYGAVLLCGLAALLLALAVRETGAQDPLAANAREA